MSLELISLENIQEFAHQYGYWAIFWGILLENLGIPLPGETVTLVGGFLAGSEELNYWLVLSDAVTGAVIGGACGYWIGKLGGWPFLVKIGKLFRISDERLLNIKDQFSQNATKAVFFGRFFALLRIFAAPLAGIAEMPFGKFFLYNLAGATAWASVMVTLAFFAGRVVSLEQLVAWVSQFAIAALLILVTLIVIPIWIESRQVKGAAGE
ncbi:DedA family protein [Anabaenopsis elenkinii]|jgi:membrane protein DedA with SNARE-associated domain|uniref:DedA family protein n=1 Tax=Anabaenopsis elenkinii CCIBt3563 TaxID=2779889 RepID=A0A7S6REX6_9CYAN|nr:DedA family protein [Anabaenopsis elenkinii]QOV23525.1 DedA family protein [Anabaenopsis elenkinii CCIBt3563]